jgi:hypothetical protein
MSDHDAKGKIDDGSVCPESMNGEHCGHYYYDWAPDVPGEPHPGHNGPHCCYCDKDREYRYKTPEWLNARLAELASVPVLETPPAPSLPIDTNTTGFPASGVVGTTNTAPVEPVPAPPIDKIHERMDDLDVLMKDTEYAPEWGIHCATRNGLQEALNILEDPAEEAWVRPFGAPVEKS